MKVVKKLNLFRCYYLLLTVILEKSLELKQLLQRIKNLFKTMDDVRNISIREVIQSDMDAIIELLQSISEFKPSKADYLPTWNSVCEQTNVHSLVAVIDSQIVGYGSIVIETKIRLAHYLVVGKVYIGAT